MYVFAHATPACPLLQTLLHLRAVVSNATTPRSALNRRPELQRVLRLFVHLFFFFTYANPRGRPGPLGEALGPKGASRRALNPKGTIWVS